MRFRSKKMQRAYRQRRALVGQLLEERPVCERCKSHRSSEVHELLSRGRGGSILDPANCVALCHGCHSEVTRSPRLAEHEGWSYPSSSVTPPSKEPIA